MVRTAKSSSSSSTTELKTSVVAAAAPSTSTTEVKSAAAATTTAPKSRAKKAVVSADVQPASSSTSTVAAASLESVDSTVVENILTSSSDVVIDPASLSFKMTDFNAKLHQLIALFSTLKSDYKTLEKYVNREMKIAQKASSKKRKSNINRKPSGFIKPTRISDELASFLGKSIGTEMARTEVSREINTYIHSNGLQDKSNGRKINPDEKLAKLLKLNKEDELTYFNLQRYMKHHFIKAEVAAVVDAAVSA